jgi:hypothetical protein
MKTKTIILLTLVLTGLVSCKTFCQVNDQTKYKMFCKAINHSMTTSPYYIVIKVKNENTNEIREICTSATIFYLTYIKVHYTDLRSTGDTLKKHKDRFFIFSADSILSQIDFFLYSKTELDQFERTLNIDSIINEVKTGRLTYTSQYLDSDFKKQTMFAHIMFDHGVLIRRGDWDPGCIFDSIYEDDKE